MSKISNKMVTVTNILQEFREYYTIPHPSNSEYKANSMLLRPQQQWGRLHGNQIICQSRRCVDVIACEKSSAAFIWPLHFIRSGLMEDRCRKQHRPAWKRHTPSPVLASLAFCCVHTSDRNQRSLSWRRRIRVQEWSFSHLQLKR